MKALSTRWALPIIAALIHTASASYQAVSRTAHKRSHHGHHQGKKSRPALSASVSSNAVAQAQVVVDYSNMKVGSEITESSPLKPMSCESIPGWFHAKPVYEDAVHSFDDGLFVEIGSYLGKSSCEMVKLIQDSGKPIDFRVVDAWDEKSMASWAPKEHVQLMKKHGGTMQDAFLHFMTAAQTYSGIHKMIRGNDRDKLTADNFQDGSINFLYVDTEHGYDKTKELLELWFRKVKVGGRMCGDEYSDRGTHLAMSKFFHRMGLIIEEQRNDQWCVSAKEPFWLKHNVASVLQLESLDDGEDSEKSDDDDEDADVAEGVMRRA